MVPRRAARRLFAQNASRARRDPRKRRRFELNLLERLEDRINLDTYLWNQTAPGINYTWNNPSNWSDQTNPGTKSYPELVLMWPNPPRP